MPSLKGLIRSAESGERLIVTGPHSDWMELLEHEQLPSQAAINHVIRALLRQYKHRRAGRFSPSSIGECTKRALFSYAGAPQLPADAELLEMADHGTFGHMRWQMEGLTMGYMLEAEKWVYDESLLTGGSIDGVLEDGSIFELKTAAPGVYNRMVMDRGQPKWEHLLQVHVYMMLLGADWASVVYEDRAYGNFHEFRVARDPKIEKEAIRRLNGYMRYVEDDLMPPMLDECSLGVGRTFQGCPYRKICPSVTTVSQAQSLVHVPGRNEPEVEESPLWAATLLEFIGTTER